MKQYLRDWGVSGLVILMLSFSAFAKLERSSGGGQSDVGLTGLHGGHHHRDRMVGNRVRAALRHSTDAIPRTAVLGAVLLTGYLGAAIAAHLRVGDAFLSPLMAGGLVWLGIYLRHERVRALLPIVSASR